MGLRRFTRRSGLERKGLRSFMRMRLRLMRSLRRTWVSVVKRVWICLVVLSRLLFHQLRDSEKKCEISSRCDKMKKRRKRRRQTTHFVMTCTSLWVAPPALASSHWSRSAARPALAAADCEAEGKVVLLSRRGAATTPGNCSSEDDIAACWTREGSDFVFFFKWKRSVTQWAVLGQSDWRRADASVQPVLESHPIWLQAEWVNLPKAEGHTTNSSPSSKNCYST